jgi:predicted DNA-binding transcriptional regulator AlpA
MTGFLTMFDAHRQRADNACPPQQASRAASNKELLTTKEIATLTGFSESYFEKARIYGYGPTFLRVRSTGKTGKILYRRAAVEAWLAAQECDPEANNHGR